MHLIKFDFGLAFINDMNQSQMLIFVLYKDDLYFHIKKEVS